MGNENVEMRMRGNKGAVDKGGQTSEGIDL